MKKEKEDDILHENANGRGKTWENLGLAIHGILGKGNGEEGGGRSVCSNMTMFHDWTRFGEKQSLRAVFKRNDW